MSAPFVLVAAAGVLVRRGCEFKFAATIDEVRHLCSARVHRGSGGKFLTAYPADDEQFRVLVDELDHATRGLPGPAILSDRRYHQDSLVHYRYGAFTGVNRLGNDGAYASMLQAPDGSLIADERTAWFTPPPWAGSPVPGPPATARRKPAAVLLHDRYEVRRAIKHANKGGVFDAYDRASGARVLIKQARPHTQASLVGTDTRDMLRHEAEMLRRLAGTGVAPLLIDLFQQSGDWFLVEEFLPGMSLAGWATERVARHGQVPVDESRVVARQLVDLVARVHRCGLVLRDMSPKNVILSPALQARLVDLEHAAEPGTMAARVYTPGYEAPEVDRAPGYGPAPQPGADLYSLGATLFYLATGCDPVFVADSPGGRGHPERLAVLAAAMRPHAPALDVLGDAVEALTRAEESQRCGLTTAATLVDPGNPVTAQSGSAAGPGGPRRRRSGPSIDEAIDGGLRYLLRLVDVTGHREVAPSGAFGATTDRCALQHGAAGPLALFTRASLAGIPVVEPEAVRSLAGWIRDWLPAEATTLPGLYFGRSGVAWALADAAHLLGDPALAADADGLLSRIPAAWPNPDVCHGAAGAGLAYVHLWRTGRPALLERIINCADGLLAAAERVASDVWWPVPESFDSVFAGSAYLGFGHGTAGIATFLVHAAEATGDDRYLDVASAAGTTLLRSAVVDGTVAWWPARRGTAPVRGPMTPHWCTGASGIGTFLIRLWSSTGDDRYRHMAELAAETAWRARWSAAPVQCHGSAGDGEFLLDLAEATGDDRYRHRAEGVVQAILTRAAFRDGCVVFPDETRGGVVADFQTGLSGTLALLLRLRHGGHRMWLPHAVRSGTTAVTASTADRQGGPRAGVPA